MKSISAHPGTTDDQALLWKPEQIDGVSLFKIRFNRFVYKKHRHQEFAIGIIEQGAQDFYHQGTRYNATPKTIITVKLVYFFKEQSQINDSYACSSTYQ